MSDIFADYSFGGWLRTFRIKRELSMRDVSKIFGMDVGNYSRLEASKFPPPNSRSKIDQIAKDMNMEKHERELLISAAFSYHLGKLRAQWDENPQARDGVKNGGDL